MPNPCGNVHMPNMPCRECDRIRRKDAQQSTIQETSAIPDESGEDVSGLDTEKSPSGQTMDGGGNASPPSKPDRLAVAQEAAEETLKRYRAKAAARQKRYRKRRKSGE